jgi:hypothetical protein
VCFCCRVLYRCGGRSATLGADCCCGVACGQLATLGVNGIFGVLGTLGADGGWGASLGALLGTNGDAAAGDSLISLILASQLLC